MIMNPHGSYRQPELNSLTPSLDEKNRLDKRLLGTLLQTHFRIGKYPHQPVMQFQVNRVMDFMEPDVRSKLLTTIGGGVLDTISTAGGSAPIVKKMLEASANIC